jgi:hypothetical protein
MDSKQIGDDVCDRKEKSSANVDGKKDANLWVRHHDTKAQHNWMMTQVQPEHVPLIGTGVTRSSAGDYDQKGNYLRGIRGKVPAFGREEASVAAVTASCNLARPSSSATRSSAQASQAA